MTVVARDATKAARRRARVVPLSEDGATEVIRSLLRDPTALPDELIEHAETREAIWSALGVLPAVQREATVQRYYLGLTEAEMARQQEVPAGTVKWRLSSVRARLRTLLEPQR